MKCCDCIHSKVCDLNNIPPDCADGCRFYEPNPQSVGMYECFNCGSRSVIWDADFDFEDYGLEGEGIVHECHCKKCGANITYEVPIGSGDDETDESTE